MPFTPEELEAMRLADEEIDREFEAQYVADQVDKGIDKWLDKLAAAGIISATDYWKDGDYSAANVQALIVAMAAKI